MDFFFFFQLERRNIQEGKKKKKKKIDFISKRVNSEYLSTYYLRIIIVKFVVHKKCQVDFLLYLSIIFLSI